MESMSSAAPHRPRRRLSTMAVAVLMLLAVPAIALANHQFSDVPTGSTFHNAISDLADAGIVTGCAAGQYCPSNPVTRAQMAGFMTRGLGSSAAATGAIVQSEAAEYFVATVDLKPGSISGGTVYVAVDADVSVVDTVGDCPCGVYVGLYDVTNDQDSPAFTVFLVPSETVDGGTAASGSVHWVFEVPSGVTGTYGVYADIFAMGPEPLGTTGIGVEEPFLLANIVAQYTPFGSTEAAPPPGSKFSLPTDWAGKLSDAVRVPKD
jgi:hypothetical protein